MKNELIERYVYDVVRRLPEKQRQDIKDELITLIEDMLEERVDNGKSEKENVEAVLRELGSPATLADKYRGGRQYLIGGEYYDTYIQVLKIVLTCVAAGLVIAAGVSFCVKSVDPGLQVSGLINIIEGGIGCIAAIPGACIQAVGIITLIFAYLETKQVKLHDKADWKLEELPAIPEKKAIISRWDSIIGIVFTVFVMILFISVPGLLGAWVETPSGQIVAVPVFNMAVWDSTLLLMLISMTAGIVDEAVKLLKGKYCFTVLLTNVATGVVGILVAIKMLLDSNVWNSNFWTQVSEATGISIPEMSEMVGPSIVVAEGAGLNVLNLILLIVIFAHLLEMGLTAFRTIRVKLEK